MLGYCLMVIGLLLPALYGLFPDTKIKTALREAHYTSVAYCIGFFAIAAVVSATGGSISLAHPAVSGLLFAVVFGYAIGRYYDLINIWGA